LEKKISQGELTFFPLIANLKSNLKDFGNNGEGCSLKHFRCKQRSEKDENSDSGFSPSWISCMANY
jgi:hypothetical protein